MNADDRYVVISADCHGGGEIHEYRDFLAEQVSRRVRRVGRRLPDPVPRPPRRPREAQLGLRPAPTRPRGRRHRRRGHLPQHHPAVLPRRRARHAGAAHRRPRPRAALGRAAGAQPLAGRLLRPHAGPPGGHRADPVARCRRVDRGDSLGPRPRAHRRHPAPRCPARNRTAPAAPPALRPALDGVRGARHAGEPSRRERGSAARP